MRADRKPAERAGFDRIAYGHRVDGLNYSQIAYQMGVTRGRARRAVHREAQRRMERTILARRAKQMHTDHFPNSKIRFFLGLKGRNAK